LDGLIQNVPDLATWKLIFEKWPYFTDDVHNVKLGLALDGSTHLVFSAHAIQHG
jgi:hypothetical protein